MINESIYQDVIMNLNVYTPNNRAYKEEINKSTNIAGYFNSLQQLIEINEDREELNNTMNHKI